MMVLDPVKLVITNYPEGQNEALEAENNPEDESAGSRQDSVRQGTMDRARGFYGSSAEEILPPRAGPDGAAEARLHHQVRRL